MLRAVNTVDSRWACSTITPRANAAHWRNAANYTEREMNAGPQDRMEAALLRARRVWKDETATVYRAAVKRHGVASSWLSDAGGRRGRIVKAPDQLARLVEEMQDAGYTLDQIDEHLLALTRRIRVAVLPDRPAA